jgi:hypothetical protein
MRSTEALFVDKHKSNIVIFNSVDQQARALNGAMRLLQVWGGAAKLGVARCPPHPRPLSGVSTRHAQNKTICRFCTAQLSAEASRLICEPRNSQAVILPACV